MNHNNESEALFVNSVFQEKIKIPSKFISRHKMDFVKTTLEKFENKCSKHGYIKKNSINILSLSMGIVDHICLQGSVVYTVKYKAMVCNPIIGSVIIAKIENINQFGLLCTVKNIDENANIIEIIVPKKSISIKSDIDLEKLNINDSVSIKLLGKKYHINDQNISGIGIVVNTSAHIQLDEIKESIVKDESEYEDVGDDVDDEDDEDIDTDKPIILKKKGDDENETINVIEEAEEEDEEEVDVDDVDDESEALDDDIEIDDEY